MECKIPHPLEWEDEEWHAGLAKATTAGSNREMMMILSTSSVREENMVDLRELV
jgi:hypothetical protein